MPHALPLGERLLVDGVLVDQQRVFLVLRSRIELDLQGGEALIELIVEQPVRSLLGLGPPLIRRPPVAAEPQQDDRPGDLKAGQQQGPAGWQAGHGVAPAQ